MYNVLVSRHKWKTTCWLIYLHKYKIWDHVESKTSPRNRPTDAPFEPKGKRLICISIAYLKLTSTWSSYITVGVIEKVMIAACRKASLTQFQQSGFSAWWMDSRITRRRSPLVHGKAERELLDECVNSPCEQTSPAYWYVRCLKLLTFRLFWKTKGTGYLFNIIYLPMNCDLSGASMLQIF